MHTSPGADTKIVTTINDESCAVALRARIRLSVGRRPLLFYGHSKLKRLAHFTPPTLGTFTLIQGTLAIFPFTSKIGHPFCSAIAREILVVVG